MPLTSWRELEVHEMGAQTVSKLATLQGSLSEVDQRRRCIREVGDLVRLYEELEQALAGTDEAELARLASTRRNGEMALAVCARRVISLRRFNSGEVRDGSPRTAAQPVRRRRTVAPPRKHGVLRRRRSLVWEAVAFVLGFAVSFLLIAGGA